QPAASLPPTVDTQGPSPLADCSPPAQPVRPRSGARTALATATPPGTSRAVANSPASPVANARPDERSCHALPPAPVPALRTRWPPAAPPPACAPPHNSLPTASACVPAPAARAGPPSHWVSAATLPKSRRTPAPCTPAAALPGSCVTSRRLPPPHLRSLLHSLHRPPVASVPVHPRGLPPRSAALAHAVPALLRSRPTRCGARAPSPAGPTVPDTPAPQPPDSAPDRPCDTASRPPHHSIRRE